MLVVCSVDREAPLVCLAMIGYIILIVSRHAGLSYFAVYLAARQVTTFSYLIDFSSRNLTPVGSILSYVRAPSKLPTLQYTFVYLMVASSHSQYNVRFLVRCTHETAQFKSCSMLCSAWVSNNVEGSYKRSVTLAMVISLCVFFLFCL